MKPGKTGIPRIIDAFGYSIKGLKAAWANESAFRQELVLAIVLIPLALWLGEGAVQKALLIFSVMFVLVVELLNCSVEAAVDRIGDEIHELSGYAKDAGSAAVFVSLCNMCLVWVLILASKF